MTIDKHTLDKAKKWAGEILDRARPHQYADTAIAAAEVVLSLPEIIVDGDKLRELADDMTTWRLPDEPSTVEDDLRKLHVIIDVFTDRALALLHPTPTPRVEIALGAWAMHPEHGKVLILSEHIDRDGEVCITWEGLESFHSEIGRWVPAADLSPVPDTHDDSEEQSEYAPGGVLPERTSTEKDQMHRTLEKLNQQYTEPQPGEAWLIRTKSGECREAVLDNEGDWNGTYDNGEYHVWWKNVTPLRRLVPAQEPRVLTTVEDYENAPVGTILGGDEKPAREKVSNDLWVSSIFAAKSNLFMSANTRTVLWEPEA